MSALVLYDGACGLCDRTVRFLAARDRRRRLRFAPLQGEAAAPWRERARARPDGPYEWLVLVEGYQILLGAAAVARALQIAGGAAAVAGRLLALLPRPLAERAYRAVAQRRHLAGQACPLPADDPRFQR